MRIAHKWPCSTLVLGTSIALVWYCHSLSVHAVHQPHTITEYAAINGTSRLDTWHAHEMMSKKVRTQHAITKRDSAPATMNKRYRIGKWIYKKKWPLLLLFTFLLAGVYFSYKYINRDTPTTTQYSTMHELDSQTNQENGGQRRMDYLSGVSVVVLTLLWAVVIMATIHFRYQFGQTQADIVHLLDVARQIEMMTRYTPPPKTTVPPPPPRPPSRTPVDNGNQGGQRTLLTSSSSNYYTQ